jgi:dolichyl-phosphate beta-glucosyltransferase
MPDTSNQICIVVPCYNEAQRLDPAAFREALEIDPRLTFLFVDDGSSDTTLELLGEVAASNPARLAVEALPLNAGKAEAVRRGVRRGFAEGAAYVGYWDADLSTPLNEIAPMVAILDKNPQILMVLGSRIQRLGAAIRRKAIRHHAGRIFATAASFILDLAVYDTQCGAKILRNTPLVNEALERPFLSRWIFDVELLARLTASLRKSGNQKLAEHTHEHPLRAWRDVDGSKLGGSDAVTAVRELYQIDRIYRCRKG